MSEWRLTVRLSVPLRHPICLCRCACSLSTLTLIYWPQWRYLSQMLISHHHQVTVHFVLAGPKNNYIWLTTVSFSLGLNCNQIKSFDPSWIYFKVYFSLCSDRQTDSSQGESWPLLKCPIEFPQVTYLLPSLLASRSSLDPDRAERHTHPALLTPERPLFWTRSHTQTPSATHPPYSWQSAAWYSR